MSVLRSVNLWYCHYGLEFHIRRLFQTDNWRNEYRGWAIKRFSFRSRKWTPSTWGLFYLEPFLTGASSTCVLFYLTPISLRPLLIGPLIPGGTSARSPFCLGLLQFGALLHGVTINYAGPLETLGRCKHFERPLYFASRPAPRRLWGHLRHRCPETNWL